MTKFYDPEKLLIRVNGLSSYKKVNPNPVPEYLIVGVRSKEDLPDQFDDQMYLFVKGSLVWTSSCTTNPGVAILKKGWLNFNKMGAAIVKDDEFYHNVYQKSDGKAIPHLHGRMQCLRQMEQMLYYLDNNNDDRVDEIGNVYSGLYFTHIHASNFDLTSRIITTIVGNWSAGCQVVNDIPKYDQLLDLIPYGVRVSYALVKEF